MWTLAQVKEEIRQYDPLLCPNERYFRLQDPVPTKTFQECFILRLLPATIRYLES